MAYGAIPVDLKALL